MEKKTRSISEYEGEDEKGEGEQMRRTGFMQKHSIFNPFLPV